MSAWTCRRQGRLKDRSTSSSNPMMEGPMCRFRREARARDIDTAVVDGLKALDPNRPIREADIHWHNQARPRLLKSLELRSKVMRKDVQEAHLGRAACHRARCQPLAHTWRDRPRAVSRTTRHQGRFR